MPGSGFQGWALIARAAASSSVKGVPHRLITTHLDLPRFRGELRAWDQSSCWGVILSSSFVAFFGSAPRGAILPSRPAYSAAVARSGGQGRPILGPPGGRVLDGREHDGRLVCVGSDLQTFPLCQSSCRADRIGTFGGAGNKQWLGTDRRTRTG